MKRLALLLASLLAIGLAHAGTTAPVTASHAWIRVLPGELPAGGYVVLRNDSDHAVHLTGASSAVYAMAMLHQSAQRGGESGMRAVSTLTIPAHASQALAPGGYHLMLMGARQAVPVGATVRITLDFSDGSQLPVDFLARPAGALGERD